MISIIQQKYSRSMNYFSASHFLPGFSKCERLHGHNYVVKVTIDYQLSDSKCLIDFRIVNSIIHSIIENLDHKILLPGNSLTMPIQSVMENKNWLVQIKGKKYSFPQKDVKILEEVTQTTTENLAIYFHRQISQKMEKYISGCSELQLRVTIAETTGNEASFS
ncbi:MAG: 6-carboxytetrahydropterin synthase, partial [Candidatus Heimdallarchaeota archaeon]|nr:6-carboxytetrahydropterin synthase [Candidatus Heimdallarchaeota archaeon]